MSGNLVLDDKRFDVDELYRTNLVKQFVKDNLAGVNNTTDTFRLQSLNGQHTCKIKLEDDGNLSFKIDDQSVSQFSKIV